MAIDTRTQGPFVTSRKLDGDAGPLGELTRAERLRAAALMQSPAFTDWVTNFRREIIVEGFLAPLYSSRGSDHEPRIRRFGDSVASDDMLGELFTDRTQDRVVNEQMLFWDYLRDGMNDRPAPDVWCKIAEVMAAFGLTGKQGGGISADHPCSCVRAPAGTRAATERVGK